MYGYIMIRWFPGGYQLLSPARRSHTTAITGVPFWGITVDLDEYGINLYQCEVNQT